MRNLDIMRLTTRGMYGGDVWQRMTSDIAT